MIVVVVGWAGKEKGFNTAKHQQANQTNKQTILYQAFSSTTNCCVYFVHNKIININKCIFIFFKNTKFY